MYKKPFFAKMVCTIGVSTALVACGGGSSESDPEPEPEVLVCNAPEVLNSAGTACETPEEESPTPTVEVADGQAIIYYLREDNAYDGWALHAWNNESCNGYADYADDAGTEWNAGLTPTGTEENFGAYWLIDLKADASCLNYIIHSGDSKDPNDGDQSLDLTTHDTVFVVSGSGIFYDPETALSDDNGNATNDEPPSVTPTSSEGIVYYYREDGQYTGWTLHAWNNETCNAYADYADDGGTEWEAGLEPDGYDDNYGAYWLFDTKEGATCANFIIHSGSEKEPDDGDQVLDLTSERWVFAVSGVGLFDSPDDVSRDAPFAVAGASAHYIGNGIIVTNLTGDSLKLVSSDAASLDESFDDSTALDLTAASLSSEQQALIPHLTTGWNTYQFDASTEEQKALVRHQLAVAAYTGEDVSAATFVQTAKGLDALYTAGDNDADEVNDYGVSYDGDAITVKVWGPTAHDINLVVYDASKTEVAKHDMSYDDATGIWAFTTDDQQDYDRLFYKFEVNVYHPVSKQIETITATDPYSVNTSTNGRYSQFVNMTDDDLKPSGWDGHTVPTIANIEDGVILEAHIRDFSVNDSTTTAANRGKYLAFTEANTDAVTYLQTLADSGVNHFHMLPANDIATVEESESNRIELTNTVAELCARNSQAPVCGVESDDAILKDIIASYDPSTNDARDLVNSFRDMDGFNWGYDPHHFNVVEGSYSSDPDGVARIKEFREMVQAIHSVGMRVVLDVVYNHTSASGLYDNSVFDKVVPGYYHRYNETTGIIENSTCCDNTATEHRMMGKFVVDSLAFWARNYGLDGFRFDIMGHMPKDVILDGRDAVAAIDPDTYFYGEGWNWGEVASNRLFYQATQTNMAGTEVGSFNDRPRDTIRAAALSKDSSSLGDIDHMRLGLAGTLANYELADQSGVKRKGSTFNQSSYGLDPADIINYVSKHDNETLWDVLQYTHNLPADMGADDRVRIHSLSAAIPLMSQGLPFFQLGVDKIRSKSLDRNTYNSGDWFNAVDYTNGSNNWNVGLPVERDSAFNEALLANTNSAVDTNLITRASSVFNEFLQIRDSSELFRLTTEGDVIDRVGFHNTGPNQTKGLIVMSLDDGMGLEDLDSDHDAVVVVINGTDSEQSHNVSTASGFTLHPVQISSADTVVQGATFTEGDGQGSFTVPAYTIAVFVKAQGAEQGSGLAVDPDFIASPYGNAELFISGLSDSAVSFEYDGRGVYSASVLLSAGEIEFSITDADASEVDIMLADVSVDDASIAFSAGSTESFAADVGAAGTYDLTLDIQTATPTLKLTLQNAQVACAAPVSAGDYPISVDALYLRGAFSEWQDPPSAAHAFVYTGDNEYKLLVDLNEDTAFKIADAGWGNQFLVSDGAGSQSSPIAPGEIHDVLYTTDGGMGDNGINVTSGAYLFNLTLNSDSITAGDIVGTLKVEHCTD